MDVCDFWMIWLIQHETSWFDLSKIYLCKSIENTSPSWMIHDILTSHLFYYFFRLSSHLRHDFKEHGSFSMLPNKWSYVFVQGYCFMCKKMLAGKISDVTFAITYEKIFVIGQVNREIQYHKLEKFVQWLDFGEIQKIQLHICSCNWTIVQ